MRTMWRWIGWSGAVLAGSVQAVNWQVIAAADTRIPTAGFPSSAAPNFYSVGLAEQGQGNVRGQLGSGAYFGHWSRVNGQFVRVAQLDAAGVQGPGRSGAESNHVFRTLVSQDDIGPNGQLAFSGRAGAPGSATSNLPNAAWLWNGVANVEILRALTDGALGPGLGTGWRFRQQGYPSTHFRPDGSVLIDGELLSPTDQVRHAVLVHRPGIGNSVCVLQGSTDPAYSPNLGNDVLFQATSGYSPWVHPDGRVFVTKAVYGVATPVRVGIFEVCNGGPQALAFQGASGVLGPDVGWASAFFTSIDSSIVVPAGQGGLVFAASFRYDTAGTLYSALFRHRNGSNVPIAMTGTTGVLGPNWSGSTFSALTSDAFAAADGHVAFEADAVTPLAQTVPGLWRIRPGGQPEPVILMNTAGILPPGQSIGRVDRWALFGNGDIVADCTVNNGTSGLYLFKPGRAPQLILSVGQTLTVAGTSGPLQGQVTFYTVPDVDGDSVTASRHGLGNDSWAGRDGSVMVWATLNLGTVDLASVLLYGAVSNPQELFSDGFE